jgi:pimeloyl-ACP methyl ester carboxylesterase
MWRYGFRGLVARTAASAVQAMTPNSKLMLLDDCGHPPQIEKPEIFNQALAEFVGG